MGPGRGIRVTHRGMITHVIGPEFKQLSKKFNYRIAWSDGTKGPGKLGVQNYSFGQDAHYDSWCLLSQL